jgi:hypothetical protein
VNKVERRRCHNTTTHRTSRGATHASHATRRKHSEHVHSNSAHSGVTGHSATQQPSRPPASPPRHAATLPVTYTRSHRGDITHRATARCRLTNTQCQSHARGVVPEPPATAAHIRPHTAEWCARCGAARRKRATCDDSPEIRVYRDANTINTVEITVRNGQQLETLAQHPADLRHDGNDRRERRRSPKTKVQKTRSALHNEDTTRGQVRRERAITRRQRTLPVQRHPQPKYATQAVRNPSDANNRAYRVSHR